MSPIIIFIVTSIICFIIYKFYKYNCIIEDLLQKLKKHDPLTSNTLRRNIEYQMDFENYINEKELDILFYNFRKLAPENQDIFLKMYRTIDTIPKEKRSWAYSQIMRTLNKG